ncbi:MAG: hypothetical protein EA425_10080 [Puniceicoccaceae bacterium]|nr:MAG: hypothetical protein EA425_10080 [Puniceicoccaceae bacterium]
MGNPQGWGEAPSVSESILLGQPPPRMSLGSAVESGAAGLNGDQVALPNDTTVTITHRFGGPIAVNWTGGMALIRGRIADALGETVPEEAEILPHTP